MIVQILFFFNDTATTEIYTLSLHDALPISLPRVGGVDRHGGDLAHPVPDGRECGHGLAEGEAGRPLLQDRKSTRLNSSHSQIPYAVFCLKKKTVFKCDPQVPPQPDLPVLRC